MSESNKTLSFNLEEWKSIYIKNDISISIPWFHKHFLESYNNDEFSIWLCDYKYNDELNAIYKTCGMINGWIQRAYEIRKIAFGSILIFGKGENISPIDPQVSGLWIFKNDKNNSINNENNEFPYQMIDCDDSLNFNWKKLNLLNDKKQIDEFLSWQGDFNGRNLMQGYIFK